MTTVPGGAARRSTTPHRSPPLPAACGASPARLPRPGSQESLKCVPSPLSLQVLLPALLRRRPPHGEDSDIADVIVLTTRMDCEPHDGFSHHLNVDQLGPPARPFIVSVRHHFSTDPARCAARVARSTDVSREMLCSAWSAVAAWPCRSLDDLPPVALAALPQTKDRN